MKKTGILSFIVSLLVGAFAGGSTLAADSMVKFNGHARLRFQSDHRTDFNTSRQYTLLRVRPSMTVTPTTGTSLVFVPQFVKSFGQPAVVTASTSANTVMESSGNSANGSDGNLVVHEAYVWLSPVNWTEFFLGRQALSYGDGLVIGTGDWGNHGRSFDALRARAKYSFGWSEFFVSKIEDNNIPEASVTAAGDQDLWGLYNSWNFGKAFKSVDPYIFYERDKSQFGAVVNSFRYNSSHLWTMGARLKSDVGNFDYRIEANKQLSFFTGKGGVQSNGDQQSAELGYTFDCNCKPRVAVEWFRAHRNYDTMYATTHSWLGFADIFGRRNITGFSAQLSGDFSDRWSWGLDYYYLSRVTAESPAYRTNGTTELGDPTAFGNSAAPKFLGHEIDALLTYKASAHLSFLGGYNQFLAGRYLKATSGFVAVHSGYLAMEMTY